MGIWGFGGYCRYLVTAIRTAKSQTPRRLACFGWSSIATASHGALSRPTESLAIRALVFVIRRLSDHFQTVPHRPHTKGIWMEWTHNRWTGALRGGAFSTETGTPPN